MKKTVCLVLCIISSSHAPQVIGGVTTLYAMPTTSENAIRIEGTCTQKSWTGGGLCGIEVLNSKTAEWHDPDGSCWSSEIDYARYRPTGGGNSNHVLYGCKARYPTVQPAEKTIRFSMELRPRWYGGLPGYYRDVYFRPYVQSDNSTSEATTDMTYTLPNGTIETYNGHGNTPLTGSWTRITGDTWNNNSVPVHVTLRYPDIVTLRAGQTRELLDSDWPIFASATTDLAGVAVTNDVGVDLISSGETTVSKKLRISAMRNGLGAASGSVTLSVSTK